eukprot:TRINITY_DN96_c1_g1_i1.p1 TRINITY_DN96_c1_g1~~TRINITY_DN96_c1_g1_i1.p1  ORF type:complete len:235 (+),score=61.76 TRINITY_DN96_c1_g1_i1:86-706(+)
MHLVCLDLYHLSHDDLHFWKTAYSCSTKLPIECLSDSKEWRSHCLRKYLQDPYKKFQSEYKQIKLASPSVFERTQEVKRYLQEMITEKRLKTCNITPQWLITNSITGVRNAKINMRDSSGDYTVNFEMKMSWKLIALTGETIKFSLNYTVNGDNSEEGETTELSFGDEEIFYYERPIRGKIERRGDESAYATLVNLMATRKEDLNL